MIIMNKKIFSAVIFSLITGAFLYVVRSGALGIRPFPLYYPVFFAVIALSFALSFLFVGKKENDGAEKYSFHKSFKYFAVVASFLLAAAAVLFFIASPSKTILTFVLTIFIFFCAVSFSVRAKYADASDKCRIFSLFPVYFSCIYLLVFYRANASKLPSVSAFAPEIFLLVLLILTCYLSSARLFGKGDERILSGVAFSFISLSLSELLTGIFSPDLLPELSPGAFLCLISGFALYYASSLFKTPSGS